MINYSANEYRPRSVYWANDYRLQYYSKWYILVQLSFHLRRQLGRIRRRKISDDEKERLFMIAEAQETADRELARINTQRRFRI